MSNIKTGGPAFPGPYANENGNIEVLFKQQGMTLRDYFAAKAMQGITANPHPYQSAFVASQFSELTTFGEYVATKSYEMANAMLEARKA